MILTKPNPVPDSMIQHLARFWREKGWSVRFHVDLSRPKSADVAVLHVDATLVEDHYLALVDSSTVMLNAKAQDISKNLYSAQTLSSNTTYSGPVIVKTVANCGGLPERSQESSALLPWIARKLNTAAIRSNLLTPTLSSRAWERVKSWDPLLYPTFASPRDVPQGAWKNPHLMVEKLLCERESDGRYVLRHWYFFGDKEFSRTLKAPHPVVKWYNMEEQDRRLSREEWLSIAKSPATNVPELVRSVRRQMGLDFGRIDWAFCDGTPVVYDVNKTPGGLTGVNSSSEINQAREQALQNLSEGILSYL